MGFYEEISKHYDDIFPVGEAQLNFIRECAGLPPKKILDVACGSGGYSVKLAIHGYKLAATDLEDEMVSMTREKGKMEGVPVSAIKCDMRELETAVHEKFDCIFCIGNSIVHLGGIGEILAALKQMHDLLEVGGTLILQIMNYDRVIKHHVTQLPVIKNEQTGLEFMRKYKYMEDSGLISFDTTLVTFEEGKRHELENSVKLFPVLSCDMLRTLKEAGFRDIQFYGDFNYSPYNEESYMLVLKCTK